MAVYSDDTVTGDIAPDTVTTSSVSGEEATALWVGSLIVAGGTSETAAIEGGPLTLRGGNSTLHDGGDVTLQGGEGTAVGKAGGDAYVDGGPGATDGTVKIGTVNTKTSAITIGHSAATTTFGGPVLLPNTGIAFTSDSDAKIVYSSGNIEFHGASNGSQARVFDAGQAFQVNRLACFEISAGTSAGSAPTANSLTFAGGYGTDQSFGSRFSIQGSSTKAGGTYSLVIYDTDTYAGGGFAPVGGTASFRGVDINYTLNTTSTGTAKGLYINAIETAVPSGGHMLVDIGVTGATTRHLQVASTIADTETCLLIRRNIGGTYTLQRVKVGAAGSGSIAAHRMLQVAD